MYLSPLIPVWFTAIVMSAILLLCVIVIYILLREEVEAWLKDREERKSIKHHEKFREQHRNIHG